MGPLCERALQEQGAELWHSAKAGRGVPSRGCGPWETAVLHQLSHNPMPRMKEKRPEAWRQQNASGPLAGYLRHPAALRCPMWRRL